MNQTSRAQLLSVVMDGLPYQATEARDVFSDQTVGMILDGTFQMELPGIGLNSGTAVVRLVSDQDRR
ncbi:MAG: hypothetical protein R3C19_03675 [Planctomycetaceae bacterium]